MKRLTILALLASPAFAIADTSVCDDMSGLARSVMGARQNGVPMKVLMANAQDPSGKDSIKAFTREIIVAAYEIPGYSSEEVKEKVITDFEDKYYLSCTKAQR